jgi:hypothetical protein
MEAKMEEQNNSTDEVAKKVVISADDAKAALEFWKFFEMQPPEDLTKAVEDFCQSPVFENQQSFKLALTKAITESDHPAFNDQVFEKIKTQCAEVAFKMEFEKNLEKELSTDNA